MNNALQRRRPRDSSSELPAFSPSADVTTFSLASSSSSMTMGIPHHHYHYPDDGPRSSQIVRRRRKKPGRFQSRKRLMPFLLGKDYMPCILGVSLLLLLLGFFFSGGTTKNRWSRRDLLPSANVDGSVPNATEWPLIHIVHTRFMQEQGHLATLGMARLHLFETFCLPTMVGQSTQDFLWIIKTDPHLESRVLDRLLALVQPYSNIYVVASNTNFLISPDMVGSWRDGAEGIDLLTSKMLYSGNPTKLEQAMALREDRPILETRLDADDGLHQEYLKYIQWVAKRRFLGVGRIGGENADTTGNEQEEEARPKWLYWCSRRHIEWRSGPMVNQSSSQVDDESLMFPFGVLNPVEHSKLCITPGITVGYNTGTVSTDVPCEAHDLLYKHLMNSTSCYDDGSNHPTAMLRTKSKQQDKQQPLCLELVDDLAFTAIRSRTWTSAGMQNVASADVSFSIPVQKEMTQNLWTFLEGRFHMNQKDAQETQRYLYEHQAQIAYENLLGQCTSFHSCKQQAKDALEEYIKGAAGGANGIQVIPQPPRGGGLGRFLRLSSSA